MKSFSPALPAGGLERSFPLVDLLRTLSKLVNQTITSIMVIVFLAVGPHEISLCVSCIYSIVYGLPTLYGRWNPNLFVMDSALMSGVYMDVEAVY